jgi:hypothetical protein
VSSIWDLGLILFRRHLEACPEVRVTVAVFVCRRPLGDSRGRDEGQELVCTVADLQRLGCVCVCWACGEEESCEVGVVQVYSKIREGVLKLISLERKGDMVDRSRLRGLVRMLVELGLYPALEQVTLDLISTASRHTHF